jgi:protein involved in polysaccharide export with SLBB domain
MIKKTQLLLVLFLTFFTTIILAQDISQLQNVRISDLSDDQINSYWISIQKKGYTMSQVETLANIRGISSMKIAEFKRRVSNLNISSESKGTPSKTETKNSSFEFAGLNGNEDFQIGKPKELLFGLDFFNNPKISFTPNLNIAIPENYQLGPGDEILIDIWGASENNYKLTIDKTGSIRIKNIGPIYISGLTIKKAKSKIKSYLKRIYRGIGASDSSYNKIFTEIALTSARTVQVNIIGEVEVPGTYSLSALSTALNALYASGGPTINGSFRTVKIIRKGLLYKEFDIYQYLISGSEKGNVFLKDQDVIIVQPYISKVKVEGEVKRPGYYELKKGETIMDLINFFGGFTSEAFKENLLVERVHNGQKKVSEINLSNNEKFLLKDGDKINVNKIINRYENRVSIEGAIYRPGNYEITEGLTLKNLIKKSGGLRDNAFLERGLIYRTYDDVNRETISFSIKDIIENSTNIVLKREDSVIVFNEEDLESKKKLTINGAVNKPQTIEFVDNMSVEDFIAISGGFKEGADPETITVSRRQPNGGFVTISEVFKKSVSSDLIIDKNDNGFHLEPFDIVFVRYKKGFTIQKNVSVSGEVFHPGNYSITNKDERISDLISRSGGLSPFAYVEGTTLVRRRDKFVDINQINRFKEVNSKDSLNIFNENITEYNIGIDLKAILKKNGKYSKFDLILKEGDKLIVPTVKQTVYIKGEVLSESIVRFDKSFKVKDYINGSGGYSESAIRRKIYVIHANGDVVTTKSFLFFKKYPKVKPGSIVVVPRKSDRKGLSTQETIGITSSLATFGILISTLLK